MDKYINIVLVIIIVIMGLLISILKRKKIKALFGTIICLALIVMGVIFTPKLMDKISYGLDLQGGFEVLYQVKPLEDDLSKEMVYNTYKAILKRIDILGVSEPEITIEGNDMIRVRLAGVTNMEEAKTILSSTANLTFRDTSNNLLLTSSVLSGSAKVTMNNYGKYVISLPIKDTTAFYNATKKVKNMIDNRMVIWLDFDIDKDNFKKEESKCGTTSSHCLSAPYVNEAFASDVVIEGNFTKESATKLVELINSGALPTKLEEVSSKSVEASFGENALNKTLFAGVLGIIFVLLIMILIYRFSGFIASFSICVYTILSLYIFYLIDGVLTLPGIAAMLLGIGMAVDATIICYERIKEQLKVGKSLSQAFDYGNKTSLSSIIDSNITTMLVAVILFIFGQSSVKGFATMLIINIIITILVMVFLNRFILKLFVKTTYFSNKINLFIGLSKKKIKKDTPLEIPFKKIKFMKLGKIYSISILFVAIILSIILVFTKFNLGIDFTGGTSIVLEKDIDLTLDLKELNYTVKDIDKTKDSYTYIIEEVIDNEDIKKINNYILDKYDTTSNIYVVSDIVKKELVKNAIYSLIISSICIVIYVSIRFKFNYAISGLIALLHDVILTILIFGIFKIEIDTVFIAAILTIIGYSINDTIVTFDMIREMLKDTKDIKDINKLDEIIDNSIKRVFSRTILTTITTIVPVICLMIFGAKEILNFNIALLIGFILGVISSIFISNYLFRVLEYKSMTKKKKDNEDDDELNEYQIKGINC